MTKNAILYFVTKLYFEQLINPTFFVSNIMVPFVFFLFPIFGMKLPYKGEIINIVI